MGLGSAGGSPAAHGPRPDLADDASRSGQIRKRNASAPLIDAIVLTPNQGELQIELKGNLAAMLGATQNAKRSPETGDLRVPVQLVAGARNPLNLEFSWTAA